MKNKILNTIIITSFLILLLEILLHKTLVMTTITYSLNLWVTSLLPSMFPFFIISDILISYDITNYIPHWLKKTFEKIFKVNSPLLTIFFLSAISGFPAGARNTRKLYDQHQISTEEANHALIFTHFANPLFVLSTIAVVFLHQEQYGPLILISHYLGNIILGLTTRPKHHHTIKAHYTLSPPKSQNFSTAIIHAIKSSIDTLLMILGTLTCFLIISALIIQQLNLSFYPSMILKGLLEMTMGLKSLSTLPLNDCYKVVISTMFISFGGLSVHLQVLSQITDTDISYHPFFIARIFHTLVSGAICYLLYTFFF